MMEHISEEGTSEQVNFAAEVPAAGLGKTLREARERLGLSVADVAAQIKFAPRQIEALEAEDFKHLPELAFVRGFVRSYAKILKLDAASLLATLTSPESVSAELSSVSVEVPFPDSSFAQRQNLVWLGVALLIAVVVVVFAVKNYSNPPIQDKVNLIETPVSLPAQVEVVSDPIVLKPAVLPETGVAKVKIQDSTVMSPVRATKSLPSVPKTPTPAQTDANVIQNGEAVQGNKTAVSVIPSDLPPNPGTLRLEFDEESWVEIKDRDGKILASQAYMPGSEVRIEGNAPFSLLIGHAPSVRLYYQDKQINLAPHTRRSTAVAYLTLE